jgi:hypothetical protein
MVRPVRLARELAQALEESCLPRSLPQGIEKATIRALEADRIALPCRSALRGR